MPHKPMQCSFFLDHDAAMPCPHIAAGMVIVPEWQTAVPACPHCGEGLQWKTAPGELPPDPVESNGEH